MNARDTWRDRLSEYLDGDLDAADRAALDEHLDRCDDCRATLAELRELVSRARHLEDRPPPRNLWDGISERILAASAEESTAPARIHAVAAEGAATRETASEGQGIVPFRQLARPDQQSSPEQTPIHSGAPHQRTPRHEQQRRFSFTIPQLAAAGIALVLLTGSIFRLLGPAPGGEGSMGGATLAEQEAPGHRVSGTPIPASAGGPETIRFASDLAGGQYDAAIADLERALAEGRHYLAPETVAVIEENLAIIDRAIEEARSALAQDPASIHLTNYLADTMRRKLELLRYTNAIVQSQI